MADRREHVRADKLTPKLNKNLTKVKASRKIAARHSL